GLISAKDTKSENKIPWVGDLPYLGALFRFRTQTKAKSELLVILTPHIVRNRADADRILAEESRRIDWCLGDVLRTHGTSGMEPVLPPPKVGAAGPGAPGPAISVIPETITPAPAGGTGGREELPPPRTEPSPDTPLAP